MAQTILLNDDEAAIVFRSKLGEIEAFLPETESETSFTTRMVAFALHSRLTDDPNFVDSQLNWMLDQVREDPVEVVDDLEL
jgi:hypothetical protein